MSSWSWTVRARLLDGLIVGGEERELCVYVRAHMFASDFG